jgi:hypothetical protein
MRVRSLFFFLLSLLSSVLYAQDDSIWRQKATLSISGFLDVYYVYDFDQPQVASRQPFLFNHNRHNEFNLNLGFVKLGLEHSKFRSNLALQTGTYANDNYSAEPGLLKNIFEANVGLSLNRMNSLWLDVGVFGSHIGFESAVSMDNWTLTRSLLAENSPYFLSGAKLTFSPSEKLKLAGLILNGWQRIQRLQGSSLPSFGTQVNYSPTEAFTFNWSTFMGTDDPDATRRMRYFNNFYGQFQLSRRFGLIGGFDIGAQQRAKDVSSYDFWFSPVIIGQFTISKNWRMAIRAEYYQDETGIIIPTNTSNGFKTSGLSLNVDYTPASSFICRLEGRWLGSRDNIFENKNMPANTNFVIAASMAVKFNDLLSE